MSTTALALHLRGLGLLGPGLESWAAARPILAASAWTHAPTVVPPSHRLPPAERRRAGEIVKASLAVAEQACADAGVDPSSIATVFSASTGDTSNCHQLCEALARPERLVSPTRFTNSVHNASAGYWHIACKSQAPSTSLCAHDGSFCAGLLEAAAQCASRAAPVLLVVTDVPYPEPLHRVRPIADTMAMAMVLEPFGTQANGPRLEISLSRQTPTPCRQEALEALRRAAPSGRALPLLEAIALGGEHRVMLDYLDDLALAVEVRTP